MKDFSGTIVRIDRVSSWETVWKTGDLGGIYDRHSIINPNEEFEIEDDIE